MIRIRVAGVLMIVAALASNIAFIGLGSVFDYPGVLRKPSQEILASFAADQTTIVTLFLVLAFGAALFIPIAVLLEEQTSTLARTAGVLAGLVQVLGLLRWPYVVPSLARSAADQSADQSAVTTFEALHQYLGVAVGETLGYLATAAWTLLVLRGLRLPGWLRWIGVVAALAILAGVLEPAGVGVAGLANFIGYLMWSFWVVFVGVLLIRRSLQNAYKVAAQVSS